MNDKSILKDRISAALGSVKADLVIKNTNILNVFTGELEKGDLAVKDGYIVGIGEYDGIKELDGTGKTVVPGFIDAHMHLESSIVTPAQYCKAVVPHGTTAIVADPHEIANVCGNKGIDYILETTESLPIDAYIMIPSCVPATGFDETGFSLEASDVEKYLDKDRVLGLAELMNYPGVTMCDESVLKKVEVTKLANKIIDGHAPGLTGKSLNAYISAGVYSDHECTSYEEGVEKLRRGQFVFLRQGTASRNLENLIKLCKEPYYRRCAFCTDDKHPGELLKTGHIDSIIRMAIELGVQPHIAYSIASINAATYFGLSYKGALCPGYVADIVVLDDYEKVKIHSVYKNGIEVAKNGQTLYEQKCIDVSDELVKAVSNTVHIDDVKCKDLVIEGGRAKVIGLVDGEIITTDEGFAERVDITNDILKLAVVERHHNTGHIGLCYVKNYGLKEGAVATTVAHDSHNIIAVGASDADMVVAINELKKMGGGMIVVKDGCVIESLPLPIAGLMCDLPVLKAQAKMDTAKDAARKQGVREGVDPFMTLSFASLSVIPTLRLTTLGVVDVERFELI